MRLMKEGITALRRGCAFVVGAFCCMLMIVGIFVGILGLQIADWLDVEVTAL